MQPRTRNAERSPGAAEHTTRRRSWNAWKARVELRPRRRASLLLPAHDGSPVTGVGIVHLWRRVKKPCVASAAADRSLSWGAYLEPPIGADQPVAHNGARHSLPSKDARAFLRSTARLTPGRFCCSSRRGRAACAAYEPRRLKLIQCWPRTRTPNTHPCQQLPRDALAEHRRLRCGRPGRGVGAGRVKQPSGPPAQGTQRWTALRLPGPSRGKGSRTVGHLPRGGCFSFPRRSGVSTRR